jgi:hypothetical protein
MLTIAGEPHGSVSYLETVKPSWAYWSLKVLIGAAVAKRLLDADPTVLS